MYHNFKMLILSLTLTITNAHAAATGRVLDQYKTERDNLTVLSSNIPALSVERDNLHVTNEQGMTLPMFAALRPDQLLFLAQLCQAGCSINAQDTVGRTPLHYAVFADNQNAVAMLLLHKAKHNTKDAHGAQPFQYAYTLNPSSACSLLLAEREVAHATSVEKQKLKKD